MIVKFLFEYVMKQSFWLNVQKIKQLILSVASNSTSEIYRMEATVLRGLYEVLRTETLSASKLPALFSELLEHASFDQELSVQVLYAIIYLTLSREEKDAMLASESFGSH